MMEQFVAIYWICLGYCHMFSNSHKLKLARLVSRLSWDFFFLLFICCLIYVCYLFNLLLFAYILFTLLIMNGMCVFT
jgi:hypothetical protein